MATVADQHAASHAHAHAHARVQTARRSPSPELLAQLRARFGERLSTSASVLEQHGSDESAYLPTQPDAVVFVHTTDEAAFVVKACAAARVPIIGFGVGSSCEGHLLAVEGGISVDFSEMNRIVAISEGDFTATVEAGVTRNQLNEALAGTGFFFSVDPGANASIGGMVATSASGTTTVRYGTMRDNIVSLTVITANGDVVRTASHARKSSAGLNLTQLFCGSEGTLGLITDVTVRIHPHPEVYAAAVVHFPTVRDAVSSVIESIQCGVPLCRAEMLDALTIRAVNAHSGTTLGEHPTLFLEFGGSQTQVDEQAEIVREVAGRFGGGAFQWATRQEERNRLWNPRHHAYFASRQLRPGSRVLTTDACVPLTALADCIEETQRDLAAHDLLAPVFGHVGDGNFHCLVLVDPNDDVQTRAAEAFSERLVHRALAYGGTCTGEHGVGLHKIPYLVAEHGEAGVAMMRAIKRALDPDNIFNPGKMLHMTSGTQ